MPEVFADDLSKESQLARSPGRENKPCPNTGEPKRSCTCYSCKGRRNRSKGKTKQRQARRGLEKVFQAQAGPSQISTSHEEHWRLPVRTEVKAGGMAKTVDTFYRNTKAQSDKDKAIGDVRPFMAVAQVDGSTDGLVVIRMSHLVELFDDARKGR
jgi:hypothetical protein